MSVAGRKLPVMKQRTLTDLENRMLDFAEAHPSLDDRCWEAIRLEFGWRPVVFIAQLFRLLNDPAAEAARPVEVHRLRRLRDERRAARTNPAA